MNEVKQAWTSLLSSRTLMTSGTAATANSTGNQTNGSNSNSTWYDSPAPIIIHNRKFQEEIMESSKTKNHENSEKSMMKEPEETILKRRVSKDSGIETIASLRRTFLDEFRKSNEIGADKIERNEETMVVSNFVNVANSLDSTCAKREIPAANSCLGAINDEVLYQNNVEAALNSLSKICVKDLDISADSTSSLKNSKDESEDDENDEDDDRDTSDGRSKVRRRCGRKRTTSDGSRRHSSSVELAAMTSVKTGEDGMPTISFSFLRTEENSKAFIRDIPIGDEEQAETSLESSEQLVREQLYDFPKRGRAKPVTDIIEIVNKNNSEDLENDGKGSKVDLPEKRPLGDGSVGSDLTTRSSEDQLYDFPKNRNSAKFIGIDDSTATRVPRNSLSSDNDERLYEIPTCPGDLSSSTWNESIADPSIENDLKVVQSKPDCSETRPRDLRKRNYRSLRSGRSVGKLDKSEDDKSGAVQAYYSDPECPEPTNLENIEHEDRRKDRKHHRRLGKAWGRMRSWLREEKSRFGEVVNRHAKMQAVGALKTGKSEDGSSLGSRSGSYDLIEARTRELGSITRVEEFGLSSVSEEGNVSEPERAECTSYDLHRESPVEIGESIDGDGDCVDSKKMSKLDSSNDLPDVEVASRRLRKKTVSTDNILSGTRMKLTPVSFSLDKLCDDEGNDDVTNAGHRDNTESTRDHVGKGGLIKRRMLGSIRGLMASTHLLQQHESEEGGPGGFEDVRRYVKQGGDFCKELAAILHERAELEASYSKGLSKLSGKLTKACTKDQGGNSSGGVTEAWRSIGEEMEAAAEAHRAWGVALSEQLAKPLRVGVAEAQGRSRKVIESSVDKASKSLQEWRGIAAKSKKQSFSCARENERLQDLARIQSISQSQQNNNKTSSHHMTEKEVNKLETRRRKAEDSSRRADTEFYTVSVRAERARLEYESTVRKGAKQMELLEEERLSALKDLANVYLAHLQALAPRLQQSADRLSSPVRNCSVSQDVDILKNVIRRLDSNDASNVDQLLPDFYAEHVTLAMNRERRKQSLVRVLHLIRQDLERERRGREGLETLHRAFIQTPAFAADESTQNVTEKLHHMRSMLTFLEAARYKVGGTLAEVEGGKRGKHPLAEHILVSRDKQGLQQSVLKVPSWAKNESFEFPEGQDELDLHLTKDHESERRDWVDRTAGDGNSENPPDEEDFSDFDEFSSQSEDNNNQEVEIADITEKGDTIEQCRAIYQYSANLNDELSLTPGDLITIHEKQADGWWIGECGGRTGIFPATYVQIVH